MILATVHIPQGTLPYIFGEKHKGQTLNLGGKYLYEVEETDKTLHIKSRSSNKDFIDGFWGENISLVNAIVGGNGAGKTTILRAINQELDVKHQNVLYIFEDKNEDNKIFTLNETSKKITSDGTFELQSFLKENLEKNYYSPVLDYELQDTRSAISLVSYLEGDLEQYYFDSITRNILFLNEPVAKQIKQVYPDFPSYDKYFIKVSQHKKSYFRKPYIDTNLGNPNKAEVVINNIDGDLVSLESDIKNKDWNHSRFINTLRKYKDILQADNFTAIFQRLWALEEYSTSNQYDYIHDGNDFFKDLEITFLSYLVLGAVFPQTGLHGGYDFTNILEEKDFKKRLDKFLELYLANTYYELYEDMKEKAEGISVENKDALLRFIAEYRWTTRLGVKTDSLKGSYEKGISKNFQLLENSMTFLKPLSMKKVLSIENGNIAFDITNDSLTVYTEMVSKYKILLEAFQSIPVYPIYNSICTE